MNPEKTDDELIAEFKNGVSAQKEKAFAELLRRHRETIYWVCRRLLGSHDDADDVTQTVFLKNQTSSCSLKHRYNPFTGGVAAHAYRQKPAVA